MTTEGLPALRAVFAAWERSSYRRIVISCEELSTLSATQIGMLRGLTAGAQSFPVIRIIDFLATFTQTLALSDDDPAVANIERQPRFLSRLHCAATAEGGVLSSPVDDARFIRRDYALTPGFAETVRQVRLDLLAIDGLL